MVPLSKKLTYSFSQVGINLLWNAFNTVAVFYYVSVLHVSATRISAGMIVYGIINAFLNLIAGQLSDRTNTRMGRRIPYIAFGAIPFAALFFLLFHPLVRSANALLWYFFIVTLLFDICFTFVALNVGALFPEMYQTQKDRSTVSALQQLFGIVGLIIGVALSKSLGQTIGWTVMGIVFGIISLVSFYVSLHGSFENPEYREHPLQFGVAVKETFKNRRFLVYVVASFFIQLTTTMFLTISSFYTKYVVPLNSLQSSLFLGSIFIVAIPCSFIWAKLAVRISNVRAAILATVIDGVIGLLLTFDKNPGEVIGTGAMLGVGIAGFMVLLNILLAEVIDYDAMRTGKRREGMYLGMNGFIIRIGMSLQYAIMAVFFSASHFQSDAAVQSAGAITGLRILSGVLPAVLLVIAILFLWKYETYLYPSKKTARLSGRNL